MGESQEYLKIKIHIFFLSWPVADTLKISFKELEDSRSQVSSPVACDQTCLCRSAFCSLDLVFLLISTRKYVSCRH